MTRYRSLFMIGLIILSTLLITYLTQQKVDNSSSADIDNNITNDEDFFADNIQILKYRKDGSVYYEMQSTHITHNNTDDTAFVIQPVMTLHAAQNIKWNARSDSGKVYNHQQSIDLIDNVTIAKHEQSKHLPVLLLTTNNITLHPENNTFTTNDHVAIKTETSNTTATGMKASMDNNHIELLNNVRTHYEK